MSYYWSNTRGANMGKSKLFTSILLLLVSLFIITGCSSAEDEEEPIVQETIANIDENDEAEDSTDESNENDGTSESDETDENDYDEESQELEEKDPEVIKKEAMEKHPDANMVGDGTRGYHEVKDGFMNYETEFEVDFIEFLDEFNGIVEEDKQFLRVVYTIHSVDGPIDTNGESRFGHMYANPILIDSDNEESSPQSGRYDLEYKYIDDETTEGEMAFPVNEADYYHLDLHGTEWLIFPEDAE